MKILDNKQINQKINRLVYQILEHNSDVKRLVFIGINTNGYEFAKVIQETYDTLSGKASILGKVTLNPAAPLDSEIGLDPDLPSLNGKNVIIVDDVANTGRTIFYAMKPILDYLPKKVEAAVLVDRKHKKFPIQVDYVGISLSTTLDENIRVDLKKESNRAAFLD